MAINPGLQIPYGVQPTNPVPVDAWSGPFTAASLVAGVSAANAAIPSAVCGWQSRVSVEKIDSSVS